MRIIKPNNNQTKNFSKYGLTFLFSVIFILSISAKMSIDFNTLDNSVNPEKNKLEKQLFANIEDSNTESLEINEIVVLELEEEVKLDFDTSIYLPEGFNPLKGKNNLDLNTIELIEIEEEVELGFDTSKYLPENFNALKAKNDLDWTTIELIEIEEEIEINFDTKAYLPAGFNPYKGIKEIDAIH